MSALADLLHQHEVESASWGWSCKCGVDSEDVDYVDHLAAVIGAEFLLVPRSEIARTEYGVRRYRRDRGSWSVDTLSSRADAVAAAEREWYDDHFEGRPLAHVVERPVLPEPAWSALTMAATEAVTPDA